MNYIPKYNYAEFIECSLTKDYVDLIDKKGVENAFRQAFSSMCTRFEIQRKLTYDKDGSCLVFDDDGSITLFGGGSEENAPTKQSKYLIELNERNRGIFNYTPSTRFFSHNTPVGERKYLLMARMFGSLLSQKVQGRSVLDHMRVMEDMVNGTYSDKNKQFEKNAFLFTSERVEKMRSHFKNNVSYRPTTKQKEAETKRGKQSYKWRSVEFDDIPEEIKAYYTEKASESALSALTNDAGRRFTSESLFEKEHRLLLVEEWDIESNVSSPWSSKLWVDAFIKTLSGLYELSVISAPSEEIYWFRWNLNARPLIEELFNLLGIVTINTGVRSMGVYLTLVLKTFTTLLNHVLNITPGIKHNELVVSRHNLLNSVICRDTDGSKIDIGYGKESILGSDYGKHPVIKTFLAKIYSDRVERYQTAEKEAYDISYDELIIENGVANFNSKFYEQLAKHSIALAFAQSAEDRNFDLHLKEFVNHLPNVLESYLYLKGLNAKYNLPEEFEILLHPLDVCGKEVTIERSTVDIAIYDLKHFATTYKDVIEKFVEFVRDYYERSTSKKYPGSIVHIVSQEGKKVAYSYDFFNDMETVLIPYYANVIYNTTGTGIPDSKGGQGVKGSPLSYEKIYDFNIAGKAPIKLSEYNGCLIHDMFRQTLNQVQFSEQQRDYYGSDLCVVKYLKEIFLNDFVTIRYEQKDARSCRVRFESNATTILPPKDDAQAFHIEKKDGQFRYGSTIDYTTSSVELDACVTTNGVTLDALVNSVDWIDYYFLHKDFELSDPNNYATLYKDDLKKFGTSGLNFKFIKYPRCHRWVSRVKGRAMLFNLVNAGDLICTGDKITRVALNSVLSDEMIREGNYRHLTRKFKRFLKVEFPVPFDVFIQDAIDKKNVKDGGKIYQSAQVLENGEHHFTIYKKAFKLSDRGGSDHYFQNSYTGVIYVDLYSDSSVQGYKLKEMVRDPDDKEKDVVVYHFDSNLADFKKLDVNENHPVLIVNANTMKIQQNWNNLFTHPCSHFTDVCEAVGYLVHNLISSYSYGLRTWEYVTGELDKIIKYMDERYGVVANAIPLRKFIATTSAQTLYEFLDKVKATNGVGSDGSDLYRDVLEPVFGNIALYREMIPTLYYADVHVMLDDVKYQRSKLQYSNPRLNIPNLDVPRSLLYDDDRIVAEIAGLFAHNEFDRIFFEQGGMM